MLFRTPALSLLLLYVGLCQSAARAQLPSVELISLSQSAAQIGSTCELTVAGSRTEELQSLFVSTAGVTVEPQFDTTPAAGEAPIANGKFKLQVADSAQPGLCEVRALGRFGLSNPRRLWLTHKAVKAVASEHSHAATAIELSSDTIVVAQCQPLQRNYYSYHLDAGQTLRAAVAAQSLDSRAVPVIVLYGKNRQELDRGRAVGAWPATVEYQATEACELTVVVYDAIYQGGNEYVYALECAQHASSDQSPALEIETLAPPQLSALATADSQIGETLPQHFSGLVGLAIDSDRAFYSSDNLATTETVASTLPLQFVGDLNNTRDSFRVEFAASQGQQLSIDVLSHSIGQLTDPRLILYKLPPSDQAATAQDTAAQPASQPALQHLVEQDDPAALGDAAVHLAFRDPQLTWTAPEDGRYRAVLQDNESGQREEQQTQAMLRIHATQPRFQLLAYAPYPNSNVALSRPTELNLIRGGACSLRIVALRRDGFNEPIEVTVNGLPAGVTAPAITIHPTQSEANLVLSSTETAEAWSGTLQVVGSAGAEPSLSCTARLATIQWPVMATRNAVQSRLCNDLMLAVQPLDTAPLSVTLGSDTTVEVKQGEKLSIPIRVTRREGGNAPCLLRPKHLLAKVTTPELTIAADQSEGNCELTVAADAPLGEFCLWMENETKVKWRDNPQALLRAEGRLAELNASLAQTSDADEQQKLQAIIVQVTAQIEALKGASAEKELSVWLATSTQRVRVVAKE